MPEKSSTSYASQVVTDGRAEKKIATNRKRCAPSVTRILLTGPRCQLLTLWDTYTSSTQRQKYLL